MHNNLIGILTKNTYNSGIWDEYILNSERAPANGPANGIWYMRKDILLSFLHEYSC